MDLIWNNPHYGSQLQLWYSTNVPVPQASGTIALPTRFNSHPLAIRRRRAITAAMMPFVLPCMVRRIEHMRTQSIVTGCDVMQSCTPAAPLAATAARCWVTTSGRKWLCKQALALNNHHTVTPTIYSMCCCASVLTMSRHYALAALLTEQTEGRFSFSVTTIAAVHSFFNTS